METLLKLANRGARIIELDLWTKQHTCCLSRRLGSDANSSTVSGSPWLPESPRWLIAKNRDQQGLEVLMRLHDTGDPNHIAAKEEFYQ